MRINRPNATFRSVTHLQPRSLIFPTAYCKTKNLSHRDWKEWQTSALWRQCTSPFALKGRSSYWNSRKSIGPPCARRFIVRATGSLERFMPSLRRVRLHSEHGRILRAGLVGAACRLTYAAVPAARNRSPPSDRSSHISSEDVPRCSSTSVFSAVRSSRRSDCDAVRIESSMRSMMAFFASRNRTPKSIGLFSANAFLKSRFQVSADCD